VLLIDCDLRRPRIHSLMQVDKKPGLVDFLYNKVKCEDIIRKTKLSNFNYITSGTIPPNPAEIVESKAMMHFLEEMKQQFEIIILDSPPIVAVVDAEMLARYADGTILVVSADNTEIELMNDAVDLIRKDKVRFLGTVLNKFKYKGGHNYYYKYYYNYSSSSGSNRKPRKLTEKR
jgi:capsular exopolysaccharide synthesis family protein